MVEKVQEQRGRKKIKRSWIVVALVSGVVLLALLAWVKLHRTAWAIESLYDHGCSPLVIHEYEGRQNRLLGSAVDFMRQCCDIREWDRVEVVVLGEWTGIAKDSLPIELQIGFGGNPDLDDEDIAKIVDDLAALDVEEVIVGPCKVTGDGIRLLRSVPSLRILTLYYGVEVSDEKIEALAELTQLHTLCLYGGPASDDAFRYLGHHSSLRTLDLDGFTLGNEALRHIARISSLETLSIGGGTFDAEGLRALRRLPRLKTLMIWNREIRAADVDAVSEIRGLEHVLLGQTSAGVEPIERLVRRTKLQTLSMSSDKITIEQGSEIGAIRPSLVFWLNNRSVGRPNASPQNRMSVHYFWSQRPGSLTGS